MIIDMEIVDLRQVGGGSVMQARPLLRLSRGAVKLLLALVALYGSAVLALLVASLVAEPWVMRALGIEASREGDRLFAGMRAIMVIGIASVPLAWTILARLLAIVDTIRLGDPFIGRNARRLRTMAWSLLGLQLLNVLVAAVAEMVSSAANPLDIGWPADVTGWLAILLLFVLAQVFEHGARMREDLEGTV